LAALRQWVETARQRLAEQHARLTRSRPSPPTPSPPPLSR
jgi:hypothetical protein